MSEQHTLTEEQQAVLFKILFSNSCVAASDIAPTDSLVDDLNMDSLDTVEAIMDIEAQFKIEISDEDINDLETVQDVMDHIAMKIHLNKKVS